MTDKEKTIKELKEALDSLDVTNKYRLNLIRAIEYLQEEPVSEELEEEIDNYVKRNGYDGLDSIEEIKFIANHFAKWQKQQIWKKVCEWLKCLNDTHYIMHYSDSQEATLEELKDWFKHYMEE